MSTVNTTQQFSQKPATQQQKNSLEIRDLSVRYAKHYACRNINLDIVQNRITAILGPSGCGKSSFLQAINRISDHLPDCETDGQIFFGNKNILDRKTDLIDLRKKIACVFQKPSPFPFSIYKNFAIPLREHGVKSKSAVLEIMEYHLKLVGLWHEVSHRLNSSALQLSGGQQQRLIIARALALKPEILLMDEPCSALDPISTRKIEEIILDLKSQYTIVIVTHNIAQAKRISDNAALFWQKDNCGYLHYQDESESFFNTPGDALCESYILGHQG